MSTYHRLPPISRTPSPPAHVLRRLQSFGGALSSLPEDGNDDDDADWKDTPSAVPAAASPPRKKRKAKKRFLSLGKDPNGKWKKRKLLREEREIQKALEVAVAESDGGDSDMLESINVAGGFLMIGEGSANPRPQKEEAKRKKVVSGRKRGRPSLKGKNLQQSSLENMILQPKKAFIKGPLRLPDPTSSISSSPERGGEPAIVIESEDEDEMAEKEEGEEGDPESRPTPTAITPLPTTELQSSQLAPPEPPPLVQGPPQYPNEAVRLLTFYIFKFPDLDTSWQITGRDMCPPGVMTRPSWPTLSLIIQRKLAAHVNQSTQRVLLNWSFTISSQPQLDAAIDALVTHGRAVHDIVLVDLDARGNLPRKLEEALSRLKEDEAFWKGREEGSAPGIAMDTAAAEEVLVATADKTGGADTSVSSSDIPSEPSSVQLQSESPPPPSPAPSPSPSPSPSPPPVVAKSTRAPATEPVPQRSKRKLSEYSTPTARPTVRPLSIPALPNTRSRAAAFPTSSASRWRSGGGVEVGTQTQGKEEASVRKTVRGGVPKKKKVLPPVPVVVESGKITLAEAMKRQQELRRGKEVQKEKETQEKPTEGVIPEAPQSIKPKRKAAESGPPGVPQPFQTKMEENKGNDKPKTSIPTAPEPNANTTAKVIAPKKTWDSALRATPTLKLQVPQKRSRGRPKATPSHKPLGVVALAPAPAPTSTTTATSSAAIGNVPILHLFPPPTPPPTRTPPELQPRPKPPSAAPKEPTREERFKAVVANAVAAAVHNSAETRIGNYQRAARSGNDALRAVAERKLSTEVKAAQEEVPGVDLGTAQDAGLVIQLDDESGSVYTPSSSESVSMSVSMSASTGTEAAEKEALPQSQNEQPPSRNEEMSPMLRERSIETVEAAVMLNAVASPQVQTQAMVAIQSQVSERDTREEDGQSQSVEIMHGADLLLWAAGAVDPNFGQHAPVGASAQQQHENALETVAAAITAGTNKQKQKNLLPKLKLRLKVPREPKIPKAATKTKVAKSKAQKERPRRKSLIVVLKIRNLSPTSVDGGGEKSSTESPPHLTAAETPVTSSPNTPSWPVASPSVSGFTPVNIPIPRPQPYRKPEGGPQKLAAPKPVMIKPRTSAVDALAAARKQTEQAKSAKFKGISSKGGSNTPSPGGVVVPPNITITTVTVAEPAPVSTPPQTAPPPFQISVTPQAIPQPVYADPGSTDGESLETPDDGIERLSTLAESPPRPHSQPSSMPLAELSTHLAAKKFFVKFNNGGDMSQLDGPRDTPPPTTENTPTLNTAENIVAAAVESSPSASVAGGTERTAETASGFSKFGGVSADITRQTTPSLGVPRATLTPEYLETKKIVPLVGKDNFLYWEPNIGVRQPDVKPLIGDTGSSSRSPIEAPLSFASLAAGAAPGLGDLSDGGRSYQSPPLQPLSDFTRSTTAPPLHSQPYIQPQAQLEQQSRVHSLILPQVPVKPSDMVFNISRYDQPTRKMVVYGKDMLADSATSTPHPPSQEKFSWDKLVKLLEASLQFDDFRECLVVNYHHMAEDEDELNEGLAWYKRDNEVVVAKVDSVGKPPAGLVARMKKERKALRGEVVASFD